MDPGETPEEAAVRELREETGLIGTKLIQVFECVSAAGPEPGGKAYYVATYTADVTGDIQTTEAGRVAWVNMQKLLGGPFGEYNQRLLQTMGHL